MFRALTPIFALIIAVGLGLTYIKTEFARIGDVQTEEKQYVEAISRASEFRQVLNERIAQKNSFNAVDLERLSVMMPDEVREVSVILDIDALARKNQMTLSNISVKDTPEITPTQGDSAGADAGATPDILTTSRDISFDVLGTYEDFRALMSGLEESLVFFDIVDLTFSETDGDLTSYHLTVRTYAFNPLP